MASIEDLEKQIEYLIKISENRDAQIVQLHESIDRISIENQQNVPSVAGPFFSVRWRRQDGSYHGFTMQFVFPLLSRILNSFLRGKKK